MELKEKLLSRIDEYYQGKQNNYAPSGNRSSSIGHPCIRYLVYARTRWNEAAPLNRGTLEIFEEGNDQEATVNRWLLDMGFRLNMVDQSFPPNEWQLTGHIDGILKDPDTGECFPVDIKSNHPNIYATIDSVDDFHKRPWMKKWYYQFQCYLMLLEVYQVFWVLMKNKSMKQIKVIEIYKDEAAIKEIKAKCKKINRHVKKKTLPDKINDLETCPGCAYSHICLPELKRDSIQIANDPEFLANLERREALEPAAKEYEKIDKAVKKTTKNTEGDRFICGDFVLEKKTYSRKGFTVEASEVTTVKIAKI